MSLAMQPPPRAIVALQIRPTKLTNPVESSSSLDLQGQSLFSFGIQSRGRGFQSWDLSTVILPASVEHSLSNRAAKQEKATIALFETTRERDVDIAFDLCVPFPTKESKGIRTIVT